MTPDQAFGLLLVLGVLIFVVLPLGALAWALALYAIDRAGYEKRRVFYFFRR